MRHGSWRTRLASAVVLLAVVAGGVRFAYWLFAPAVPWLAVLAVLSALYLFMVRPSR
jgi:hypothetical protein